MSSSSSSSSSSCHWRYHVFPSFNGEDVRRTFLSHFHREFQRKGIETFKDHAIKRSQTIGPELVEAIRESRISIVVLSRNYACSSWCLNELLEIMNCRQTAAQVVMPIFYRVDPSDVRRQSGDFGKAFEKTCVGKTEEEKQRWRQALIDVASIAGEHSQKWENEANMIEKIARDVSNELNYSTPSTDFDSLVGIEAHMAKVNSLLCLESNEVRMVGIWGPAGIGKTTIARALYNQLSSNFQLDYFMTNVGGRFRRTDLDDYGFKLHLQEQFLSKILDQKDLRIRHLDAAKQRLRNLKVLVVLDGVDKLEQLEALAGQSQWFGFGSRVIVTTEDKKLLSAHEIHHIYRVRFPSRNEALQIFCQYAFRQSSPPEGFKDLALEVADLAGCLPLGLSVLGSYLRGMSKDDCKCALPRLRTSLDGKIKDVLRVGYDGLDEKDQTIFRYIACLFNGNRIYRLKQLLVDSKLDVSFGLQVLAHKSLINVLIDRCIVMHNLLEQVGREVVRRQSINEPGKREFLVDPRDIYDILTENTGTEAVLGISLNISEIDELFISGKAFKRMQNLRFIRFYVKCFDKKVRLHLPRGLDYLPCKLKLLYWEAYPLKSLPPSFCPGFLVELIMPGSKLEKLWEGIQPLRSLKKMDLSWSMNLQAIPDLSKATNLKRLKLIGCTSLLTLPSSIRNLNKLKELDMCGCKNLEVLPTNINMESLFDLDLSQCSRLKSFPEISQKIGFLDLCSTAIEEVPSSIRLWSRLATLRMFGCKNLKAFPQVPDSIEVLHLGRTGIEEVPSWIQNLFRLRELHMSHCEKLKNITSSISKLEHLEVLDLSGCRNVASFPTEFFQSFPQALILKQIHFKNLPIFLPDKASPFLLSLDLSFNDFESIPDCFKFLSQLRQLYLFCCRKLVALPELPDSLSELWADGCESLERISRSFDNPEMKLGFRNCFKLNEEAQELIQQSVCRYVYLPGREVPASVTHRASGSSLTIQLAKRPVCGFLEFKPCVVHAERHRPSYMGRHRLKTSYMGPHDSIQIKCHIRGKHGDPVLLHEWNEYLSPRLMRFVEDAQSDHLIILGPFHWPNKDDDPEAELNHNEILLEFSCTTSFSCKIRGCGVQVLDPTSVCENRESNADDDGGHKTRSNNVSSDSDVEMSRNWK